MDFESGKKIERIAEGRSINRYEVEDLLGRQELYLGIDIGSTSSDVVVMDDGGRILYSSYKRTCGQPVLTVRGQLTELFEKINESNIAQSVLTGSAGRFVAKLLGANFVNEIAAQAAAICHLYPENAEASIIEMGGQDSKLIFVSNDDGRGKVVDFALNTVCAAGTGSFLDQQAERLGVDIEGEFGEMARACESVPRLAGRCSVFAKSDMIHLQQQATPTQDIIAGLCLALARNLKSNLGCGRKFVRPIIFTGGVAANIGVVKALEDVFELSRGQLIVPKEHFFTGAIGAILVGRKREASGHNGHIQIEKIDEYLQDHGNLLEDAPRREALKQPSMDAPKSHVFEELLEEGPVEAYLGVDVGSISTNVAVIDKQRRVLAKAYLMTAGRPIEAVGQGLKIVGEKVNGKVRILGAATTGSGRYLTGDFIGADVVINEITAQAAGAAIVNPQVDTIFEIGGQDSKFISLENGVVVDFEMNHACAAGTGSFLEEQAQRLGISIKDEFSAVAYRSAEPIKLGERCTVFMESDLLSYQQKGAKREDLVAGLSYSIVSNYLNRVVGRKRIGKNICFQGGTAFNKAVWSAFESVTGKQIMVPDHHEVTGAIGAASIAADHMAREGQDCISKFKGFERLSNIEYSVETFTCEHCANNCEIKKVELADADPLYYGCRCDRYNLKKSTKKADGFDGFAYRKKKLFEMAGLHEKAEEKSVSRGRIGIPLALVNWQLLPLFGRFFKELGFEVVLSGATNKRIIRKGVESVTSQPCFPVKVAYGHIAELLSKDVDHIFLPSIVSMWGEVSSKKQNQLCPYVQSFPYQVKAAFGDKPGGDKLLTSIIRMGDGPRLMKRSFSRLGAMLGISGTKANKALNIAMEYQRRFEESVKAKGREILNNAKDNERIFVLVSRPYNGCDEGVNLQLSKKLAELGVQAIPMDMLDIGSGRLSDDMLEQRVYWSYGKKILQAAEIIKEDERLFAIYLSNFGCGPDSFMISFFRDIMAQKPCLQLELDEHSADAGVITRLEAFLESLNHYRLKPKPPAVTCEQRNVECTSLAGRKLFIHYLSDCVYGIAACFRAYGQEAEVLPMVTEKTLLQGRRYTTGKECLPCAITTGDMLEVLKKEDPERIAFFMPASRGPCRFGMYNCFHKLVLRQVGADGAIVVSPDQDGNFYKEFCASVNSGASAFKKDVWVATAGLDLLKKVIMRVRPFARDKKAANEAYKRGFDRWIAVVEQGKSLEVKKKVLVGIADELSLLELDKDSSKPRIGIVGEIYVRNHPFANMNIIERLEELGAVCEMTSLAEWIYYINYLSANKSKREFNIGQLFGSWLTYNFQRKLEQELANPLEEKFGKLADEPVEKVIELARPYIDKSFEGEAILSVGKMVEFYHEGAGGVVNVMPFSCMPSTVVNSQTQRISGDCEDMPILNLSFDGHKDSSLTTRLEAFVEQVRQRHVGNSCATELMNVR